MKMLAEAVNGQWCARFLRATTAVASVILAFCLFAAQVFALNIDLPKPTGYLNDFAGVLSVQDAAQIDASLKMFEQQSSNEIAVAIITSLQGIERSEYAKLLFKEWQVGKASKKNGILFLVAIQDREAFIAVGPGLEGAMPDILTWNILEDEVFPEFKQGGYAQGINKGLSAIMKATKGEYKPEAGDKKYAGAEVPGGLILFGIMIVINLLARFLGKTKSWWLGGVIGGVAGFVFGLIFLTGLAIAGAVIVVALVGLLFDLIVSKAGGKGGTSIWFGGGRGGSGGSGGGFGGFGGGSWGGGGAGGKW